MNAAPHFIYGPGDDALALTVEHGGVKDEEQTKAIQEINNKKLICQQNGKKIRFQLKVEDHMVEDFNKFLVFQKKNKKNKK